MYVTQHNNPYLAKAVILLMSLLTHFHLTLGPRTVLPLVAWLDRTRLPLLHLRGTGPTITPRRLDHRPLPRHLTFRKHIFYGFNINLTSWVL